MPVLFEPQCIADRQRPGTDQAHIAPKDVDQLRQLVQLVAAQEPAAEAAPVPPVNPLRTQDELQRAYQKEYAFLEAQLRDLQTRLAQFESESRRDEQQREEYIDLQSRGERINGLITEAERQIGAVEDSRSTLEAAGLEPEDLDLIVLGTLTPDHLLPGTSADVEVILETRDDVEKWLIGNCYETE